MSLTDASSLQKKGGEIMPTNGFCIILLSVCLIMTVPRDCGAAEVCSGGGRWVHLHVYGDTHLVYGDERDEAFLSALYGANWRDSVAYRSAMMLRSEHRVGALMDDLQETSPCTNTYYNIIHDDQGDISPGEIIRFYNNGTWIEHPVGENETLDSIAAVYGVTAQHLKEQNPDRFNVWPHARGGGKKGPGEVFIAQDWQSSRLQGDDLAGLLAHEGAHTADRVSDHLRAGDYGRDGRHSLDEVTNKRTAIIEGWAIYNDALVNPIYEARIAETRSLYDDRSPGTKQSVGSTFENLLANEATVADILFQIDGRDPERRKRILETKTSINADIPLDEEMARSATEEDKVGLERFLERYVQLHPEDGTNVQFLYDANTRFQASNEHFEDYFGVASSDYLDRRERLQALWEQYRENALIQNTFTGEPREFIDELKEAGAWPDDLDDFDFPHVPKPSRNGPPKKKSLGGGFSLLECSTDPSDVESNKAIDDMNVEGKGKGPGGSSGGATERKGPGGSSGGATERKSPGDSSGGETAYGNANESVSRNTHKNGAAASQMKN